MPRDRERLDQGGPDPPAGRRPEAVRVELLGGFRVRVGSRVIAEHAWRLRKAAALIKLLSLSPDHRLHREQAMDLLWPDLAPKAAANNLHRTLHAARRTLEPTGGSRYLQLRDERLAFCPEGSLRVDVEAFEAAASAARRSREPASYRAAIDLYTGELLPGDRHERLAEDRRARLRRLYLDLLGELGGLCEASGEFDAGIEALGKAVAEEPTHEGAHVGLMRLYVLSGRREEALRQYERLERELEGQPSGSARAIREDIEAGRFPPDRSRDTGEKPIHDRLPRAGRHNLPEAPTSFVGREKELAQVRRLLATTSLLTLTGTGGSGKTRLALEAAKGLVGSFPDGVWLVELAPLSDGALVEQAAAEAVGAREEPGRPLEAAILEALRDKSALLVLDNCEHLIDAVARLVETLVQAYPRLKVLATSREVLDVAGETVWRVPPLSVPEERPSVGELGRCEAARLFADRAARGFALLPENAQAVATVCRTLEGIPLAIELAAARVGTMSPAQISERLDDSLGLLSNGGRTATPRQRTLRGALDWSHDLLPDDERALFRRLSVFAGGFTLEAAEAVGGASDALDTLASLVDKSLVVAEVPFRARYRLLEPVRQYALEKLVEAREEEDTRRAHAAYFLRLAERAEPGLTGSEQGAWLERLDLDHDNLRAAMGWYAARGEPEALLRMAGHLWWFWRLHGHYGEGRAWLGQALAAGSDAPAILRAKALTMAGDLAFLQSEYGRARKGLEEGLALYRTLGDRKGIASAVQLLGSIAREQGRYEQAEIFHVESLALWRKLGDEWGVGQSLNYLGFVAWLREDYERATELCTRTLETFRRLGDGEGTAWSKIMLGAASLYQDDHERATSLLEEGLALCRRIGYREGVAWALDKLGVLARRQKDHERAAILLRESLALHRDLGDRWRTASLLEELAGAEASLGCFERAATLFGAAEALRATVSIPVPPCERADRERDVAAVRAAVGGSSFQRSREAGHAMPLKRAYEYALGREEPPSREPEGSGGARPALTRREEEVAALVARGLTNRRIAEELSISERTVETHVGRILKKLDLDSRSRVAEHVGRSKTASTP